MHKNKYKINFLKILNNIIIIFAIFAHFARIPGTSQFSLSYLETCSMVPGPPKFPPNSVFGRDLFFGEWMYKVNE